MAQETSISSQYGLRRLDEIATNADESGEKISIFVTPLSEEQRRGETIRKGGRDVVVNKPLESEVNATITYTAGSESKIF